MQKCRLFAMDGSSGQNGPKSWTPTNRYYYCVSSWILTPYIFSSALSLFSYLQTEGFGPQGISRPFGILFQLWTWGLKQSLTMAHEELVIGFIGWLGWDNTCHFPLWRLLFLSSPLWYLVLHFPKGILQDGSLALGMLLNQGLNDQKL